VFKVIEPVELKLTSKKTYSYDSKLGITYIPVNFVFLKTQIFGIKHVAMFMDSYILETNAVVDVIVQINYVILHKFVEILCLLPCPSLKANPCLCKLRFEIIRFCHQSKTEIRFLREKIMYVSDLKCFYKVLTYFDLFWS